MRIMLFFMTLPESYFVTKWSLSQLTISTNLTRGQSEWLLFADKGELNTSNRRIKVRFTLLDTKIGDQGLIFTPYTVHRADLFHAKVSALDLIWSGDAKYSSLIKVSGVWVPAVHRHA
jgi:hypothetical protein